jgi:hypothetical protein
MTRTTQLCFAFAAAASLTALGCGDSIDAHIFDDDAATADASDTSVTPDAPVDTGVDAPKDAPSDGACGSAADCDDHLACTVDTCVAGACQHAPGGASACPSGQFCDVLKGCVAGVACADTAQCEAKFGGDACKVGLACDPATSICTYQTLDKDKDGHPPAVCGGDDCDDSDPKVYPGAPEICDGKANGCTGTPDQGATCAGLEKCISGSCQCPASALCGSTCVDIQTDPSNCGHCGNRCGSGATCTGGACICNVGAVTCGTQCVDIKSDPNNCNGCGNTCAAGVQCVSGVCKCAKLSCAGKCTDGQTDNANCGTCGNACTGGRTCQAGTCVCGAGLSQCSGGKCVDFKTDPANCGSCGNACGSGTCNGGLCQTCSTVDMFILMDQSGSMQDGFSSTATTPTKYQGAAGAIDAFTAEAASAKMSFALGFWPVPGAGTPPPTCMTNADCGPGGTCFGGTCLAGTGGDSCVAADYQKPAVPFAPAGTSAGTIQSTLAAHTPNYSSTPPPGLQGSLDYVKQWATANPTHTVVLIAIADGAPNECTTTNLMSDLEPIAKSFATGTPKVLTYVIGLPNPGDTAATPTTWNAFAAAGGTGTAWLPTSQASVLSALESIRGALNVCK